ncbi:MAG: hypothetical protein JST12_08925 [Armatimonadetes bacterium]|nr:hypothetical protein [Armatimonadota bacterium]
MVNLAIQMSRIGLRHNDFDFVQRITSELASNYEAKAESDDALVISYAYLLNTESSCLLKYLADSAFVHDAYRKLQVKVQATLKSSPNISPQDIITIQVEILASYINCLCHIRLLWPFRRQTDSLDYQLIESKLPHTLLNHLELGFQYRMTGTTKQWMALIRGFVVLDPSDDATERARFFYDGFGDKRLPDALEQSDSLKPLGKDDFVRKYNLIHQTFTFLLILIREFSISKDTEKYVELIRRKLDESYSLIDELNARHLLIELRFIEIKFTQEMSILTE